MAKNHLARLKRNYPLLRALRNSSNKERKLILKKANADLLKTIADICYNLNHGNITLPEYKRKKFNRYRNVFRRLGDKNISLKCKHKDIVQKGGFLGAIIPAISIVASIVSGLLAK